MSQSTNSILMIRPNSFYKNEQTAINNYYQKSVELSHQDTTASAILEFDEFVKKLKHHGINVIVFQDTKTPKTPDSIFPNNWVSFHENNIAVIYPMFAENRRIERNEDVIKLIEKNGFTIEDVIDYTSAEESGFYLEGTGSIVLDRENKKAYCSISPRADEELFIEFCEDLEYLPVIFNAYQKVKNKRLPIYHTNVMMSITSHFAMICLDAIDCKSERKQLVEHLKKNNKEIITLTASQIQNFAGNTLELKNKKGDKFLIMSTVAYHSLTTKQKETIKTHCDIIHSPLDTIESCGGGSARCMIAEIFLTK